MSEAGEEASLRREAVKQLSVAAKARDCNLPLEMIERALEYDEYLPRRIWVRTASFYWVQGRVRRRELFEECVQFVEETAPKEDLEVWLGQLRMRLAEIALHEYYDPAQARALLPKEGHLEVDHEARYFLLRACLEELEGYDACVATWKRAAAVATRAEVDRTQRWMNVMAPLIRDAPAFLQQRRRVPRPRDLSAEAVAELCLVEGPPDSRAMALSWLWAYYLDRGQMAEASAKCAEGLDLARSGRLTTPGYREDLTIEAAFMAAYVDRDLAAARAILPERSTFEGTKVCWLRAAAAMEMLSGHVDSAESLLREAEAFLNGLPDPSDKDQLDRELIEGIRGLAGT